MLLPDVPVLMRATLRTGIYLSIPLLLIGSVLAVFSPAPPPMKSLAACWQALRALQPMGLLFAGLAVLVLSPLAGLLAAGIGYLYRRERLLALVAVVLLLIILATFLTGG